MHGCIVTMKEMWINPLTTNLPCPQLSEAALLLQLKVLIDVQFCPVQVARRPRCVLLLTTHSLSRKEVSPIARVVAKSTAVSMRYWRVTRREGRKLYDYRRPRVNQVYF